MSKKKTIIFICVAVVILLMVITAGLMIIAPTLFFAQKDAENDEDKPMIAGDISGKLEIIGSEEELKDTEIIMETSENEESSEYNIPPTSPEYSVWDELGLPDPTLGMEDIDESQIGNFDDDEIQLEVPQEWVFTSNFVAIENPQYLTKETNLGINGRYNLSECLQDYLDYYIGGAKKYDALIVEGTYEDKGNYRSFVVEIEHEEGTWVIECDYVVTMNYYEFFCDDINPRPKTGED